jgi:pimeloyl-ACP methyl ester carboxylesterase
VVCLPCRTSTGWAEASAGTAIDSAPARASVTSWRTSPMVGAIPQLPGVSHHDADVRGIRLHYAEAGAGEPVVLLHGWPQHWWMWRHQIPPLAERFRVIAPDLRGHGWSDKPRSSYRKSELADDIVALLDALGLDRVRLVGHDWGAITGVLVAAGHPERIERFAALSVPHPWQRRPDPVATLATSYQLVLSGPWGKYAIQHGFMREMLKRGRSVGSFTPEEIEAYESVQRDDDAVAASVQLYRTFVTREIPVWLRGKFVPGRLTVPTLWLVGEHDVLARNADDGYRDHADDMTLERIDRANHFMPEELPDVVTERLLAFL